MKHNIAFYSVGPMIMSDGNGHTTQLMDGLARERVELDRLILALETMERMMADAQLLQSKPVFLKKD